MPHRPSRARRAGYTLALVPLVLASASGAPAHGLAASAAQSAHTASGPRFSSAPAAILIPCITGTCEVPLRGTSALVPLKPAPPAPVSSAPEALAAR